jgi:RNA polymerase sigma-70 factor (ECF subfamily)
VTAAIPATPARVQLTEALVRAHQAAVWRHLRMLGARPEVADDLAQETFVRLWQRPPEDRGPAALAAWLRATARHLLANDRRRPRNLPFDEQAIEVAHADCARDDDGEGYRAALDRCLRALPPREQRALELRYGPGGSRAAVGAALNLQDEGVKTFLRRARARLLTCIHRNLDGP